METTDKRYFVDIRSGCAAIRDTKHESYDKDYQGLHQDTPDVVEYKIGFRTSNGWEMKQEDLDYLNYKCNELNLMGTTNKAVDLAKEINIFMCDYWRDFPTLGSNEELSKLLIAKFNIDNYKQSEVDELTKASNSGASLISDIELLEQRTKERDELAKSCKIWKEKTDYFHSQDIINQAKNAELTKDNSEVVDLLKSYCIKCDEQTNEIERLKKEREALIDNFSGDKLMKQQKHFVSLYGSDEMGQEKANSFAVGFGKAAELMCNQLTTN